MKVSFVAVLLSLLFAPAVSTEAAGFFQSCQLRTQGYLGGCDNIYARWFDGRRDALSYRLIYADGYSVTVDGSRQDHSRIGVGCGWGGQITIVGSYPGGASCLVSYTGNLPHNRPCEQCSTVVSPLGLVNAANGRPFAAAGSIVSAYGSALTTVTEPGQSIPLPELLADVRVFFNDQPCGIFYVSPGQVNFLLPRDAPSGLNGVTITNAAGVRHFGQIYLSEQSPGVFTRDGSGQGVAAGEYLAGHAVLYLTGVVPDTLAASDVRIRTGGIEYPASWVGYAPGFVGLVQINVRIPISALGQGATVMARSWESQGFSLLR